MTTNRLAQAIMYTLEGGETVVIEAVASPLAYELLDQRRAAPQAQKAYAPPKFRPATIRRDGHTLEERILLLMKHAPSYQWEASSLAECFEMRDPGNITTALGNLAAGQSVELVPGSKPQRWRVTVKGVAGARAIIEKERS